MFKTNTIPKNIAAGTPEQEAARVLADLYLNATKNERYESNQLKTAVALEQRYQSRNYPS